MLIHHPKHGSRGFFGIQVRTRREITLHEREELLDAPNMPHGNVVRSPPVVVDAANEQWELRTEVCNGNDWQSVAQCMKHGTQCSVRHLAIIRWEVAHQPAQPFVRLLEGLVDRIETCGGHLAGSLLVALRGQPSSTVRALLANDGLVYGLLRSVPTEEQAQQTQPCHVDRSVGTKRASPTLREPLAFESQRYAFAA